jgi:glycosyltransferase involved in cell wall biosynthesis
MKVLFVGPLFPLPAHSGGQIAALETLHSLQPFCEIDLLVPPPEYDREANQAAVQQLLPNVRLHYYPARAPRRFEMYTTAIRAAVTGRSYWERSWFHPELRATVERLHAAEVYEAVHCEWLRPAVSLRGLDLPLVIRTPDVHFLDMQTWAESRTGLRRLYWRAQAKRFRRFEMELLSSAKTVVTLSREDEALLRDGGVPGVVTIPPPRALEPLDAVKPTGITHALFIGRLDMTPNREAFFLFVDAIWPRVRQEVRARVRIVFAGGFPDDDVRRRAAACGFELHAPLSDTEANRLFHECEIFFSPIVSGTGIKMKTLEAMARGKAMIGFPNAFRGVPAENGLQALIADNPVDFARLLEQLIDDGPRRRAIGLAGRDLIRTDFDPAILGERLASIYPVAGRLR